jgi:hypothetical protein
MSGGLGGALALVVLWIVSGLIIRLLEPTEEEP